MDEWRSEKKLRLKLAKKLGIAEVEEEVWKYLVEARFVAPAQDPSDPEGFISLIEQARVIRRHFARRPPDIPRRQRRSIPIQNRIPERHVRRAQAFSSWVAHLAAQREEVRNFRAHVLEGPLLNETEARDLLDSDLVRIFGVGELASLGVPIVGHRSRTIYFDSDGNEVPLDSCVKAVFNVQWDDQTAEIPFPADLYLEVSRRDCPVLAIIPAIRAERWTSRGFRDGQGRVLPNSVLGSLRAVSAKLAEDVPWAEDSATWFVLTGQVPYITPIDVDSHHLLGDGFKRLQVTLIVDVWLPPRVVLRAYKRARRELLRRHSYPPSDRNVALLEFVSRTRTAVPSQSWEERMMRWNEECDNPDWRYDDRRVFCRDFNRAKSAVALPKYPWL